MIHFNLPCSFKKSFMPPIKSKYHTSCLYILAYCPRFFKELVTPPNSLNPTPQLPLIGVIYSYSLLRSTSLNKTVCATVNFKENTLLCHEKRHQSTRFILVWKKFENLLDSMWTSCSTWEWEDAIGSLSIAVWKNTNQKKGGRGEKSHDLGNRITLWIIYQETLKKTKHLCFYSSF